jgi:hypothetical protein
MDNVAGKMKIITMMSMMQLKNQTGTFLAYLKRKGVYIKYKQLGIFDMVTLGLLGEAHRSFSFRDKMKDWITKMMDSDCVTV